MMIHDGEIQTKLNNDEKTLKDWLIVILLWSVYGAVAVYGLHFDKWFLGLPLLCGLTILGMLLQNCFMEWWLLRRINQKVSDCL